MEKINGENSSKRKNKSPNQKSHGIDFSLRVIAAVAAVLVWFILSITQYPTVNKSISSVPVTLTLEGTIAKEKGLSALNFDSMTVDVEIKGMNYVIGNYTANDLVASVDVSKVNKEGHYDLEIDVKSTHSSDSCTIVSVSPSTVSVNFDRITEKDVKLEVEAPNVSAKEGFTLKDSTVTPDVITIHGPEKNLENVFKVVAKIDRNTKLTEDTSMPADDIILYDKELNEINDSSIITDDKKNFNVNFIVYKKKTLKLKVDITGAPDNFDVSKLPINYSMKEVTILTPKLNDNSSETVTLGSIPLSQIRLGKTETYNIPLSEGESILSGESKVTVSFDSAKYASRSVKVSSIDVKNTPSKKDAAVVTRVLSPVTLYGPKNELDKLKEEDLVAVVDLAGITNNGSYSKAAVIKVKNNKNIWAYGTNEVQVDVHDETDASEVSG